MDYHQRLGELLERDFNQGCRILIWEMARIIAENASNSTLSHFESIEQKLSVLAI